MDFAVPSSRDKTRSVAYKRALAKKKALSASSAASKAAADINDKLAALKDAKKLRCAFLKIIADVKRTQGSGYEASLRPVPVTGEGDKITLPQSALNVLGDAIGERVLTFSLSTTKEEDLCKVNITDGVGTLSPYLR